MMHLLHLHKIAQGSAPLALRRAFSLVEVVIAIGIVSFGILAVISLLSMGVQNSLDSADDTNLALMAQTLNGTLRAQSFNNLTTRADFAENNTAPDFYFNSAAELTRTAAGVPSKIGRAHV